MLQVKAFDLSVDSHDIISSLPWENCAITLRNAGDLGPSGFDQQAMQRRNALLAAQTILPQLRTEHALAHLLGCKQVHGLRVLMLCEPGIARVFEGRLFLTDSGQSELEIDELPALGYKGSSAGFCASYQADGIILKESFAAGLSLSVTVADCMPLFVKAIDQEGKQWRALLHSGWQSTGILAVALQAIASASQQALSLSIMAGPAIAVQDYPIPFERSRLFAQRFGEQTVSLASDGRYAISLLQANIALAQGQANCQRRPFSQAISVSSFQYASDSTASSGYLHSFRRDGAQSYGRMLAIFAGQAEQKPL